MDKFFNFEQGEWKYLTSHIIAIAALVIACFAITGHIYFRDHLNERDYLKAICSPSTEIGTNVVSVGTLPVSARVTNLSIITQELTEAPIGSSLSFIIGTSTDPDKYVTKQNEITTAGAPIAQEYSVIGAGRNCTRANPGKVISGEPLEIQVTFTVEGAVLTKPGAYKISVEYFDDDL